METTYDDYTAYVQPDEAPITDEPMYSKTASRRTVAKYLKRKNAISKLIAQDQNPMETIKMERLEPPDNMTTAPTTTATTLNADVDNGKHGFQLPYFNQDIPPFIFPISFPNNNNNNNLIQDNKEINSSISEMLKCVLESNKGFVDVLEKNSEFPNPWLTNGIPFDYCQTQISSSSLSASIDKQEREIAYNLLLRRIIDEALDRNVIFSHQPKELLNLINTILVRQFPEYEESKHRSKVRSYLKACRRNSKKNNGRILMKNTAAYLSSGPGNRLMHQIYNNEKETIDIIKKESERFKLTQNGKISQSHLEPPSGSSMPVSNNQQQILNMTNTLPALLPVSMYSIPSNLKPNASTCTSKNMSNINALPLLLPLHNNNNTNNSNINNNSAANFIESNKRPKDPIEQNISEDVIKNVSEIVRNIVNSDCNFNLNDLINQLNSTASFLERFAKTLEKSTNNFGK